MLTPERWQKVRDVLEQALELAPERRSRFLDVVCSSDPSLRSEVQSLLSADAQARSSFLEAPPVLPTALSTGTRLDDYEILSQIGSGGMGVVYRARDTRLGRDVAIKVLPAHVSSDANRLKRFEQEAQSAAALNHPNILAVYQLGSYQGAPYLVSELLEGETLREQLKQAQLSQERALDCAQQIADGLSAAHERGIIHRDLKPENLFVTKDNRIKILDFGLAKLVEGDGSSAETVATLGPQTHPGMIAGTVGYMSPEQVRGEKLDTRTDLFSFGVVLYEMATGKRPFEGDTSGVTFEAILNRQPTPPTVLNTKVAPELERIISKALEKDREVRYQHAADIRADIKRLKRDTESGHTNSRFAAAQKKNPLRGWLWTAGAGMLITATVLTFFRFRAHNPTSVPHAKAIHKQFTFSGNAYSPAIAPDGNFVAFVRRKSGEDNTLVVQASNGTTQELSHAGLIEAPRWSPNGSELLYYSTDSDSRGIRIVSRLGGAARRIGSGAYGCWLSEDGSQAVYANESEADGFHGFHTVNLQSGETKDVSLPKYTAISDIDCSPPTGLILLVLYNSGSSQILLCRADGSGQRKLIEDKEHIYSARWSPTGDVIYSLHGKGSTKELSRVTVSSGGTDTITLAEGLQTGGYFTLSADGRRLAYTRSQLYANLWRVELPTRGESGKPDPAQLTSGTSYFADASYSPDGRWIAFTAGPNWMETNIFKMPSAGGDHLQLTYFEHAFAASPGWSPDGQRIAFISDQDGTPKVWEVSSNGGSPHAWTSTNASETNATLAWSPVQDVIYQQPGVRNYLRVDEKAHTEKPIIQGDPHRGWLPYWPYLSPDGKKLAFYWNRKDSGTWIVSMEPYSETLLRIASYPVGWSPDGSFIYVLAKEKASTKARGIFKVQVSPPHNSVLAALLPTTLSERDAASVSPNGREIVASITDEKSDVWLLENFDPH
jgi:eukaryotic-like serine/threonine-protein kinase